MASIHRDLGDPRLWVASHHRSQARRNAAQMSRRPSGARAGVALAVTASAVAVPAIGGTISVASADSGLTAVQKALGVPADGQMGPQTRRAIPRFQRSHGLPVVGVAGPRTRAALGLDGNDDATDSSDHASLRSTSGDGGGSSIADVQRHLGVDADGILGPQTRSAIRSFQTDHNLPATGRLDGATRSQILQADPPASSDDSSSSSADTGSVSTDPGTPAGGVSAAVAAARAQIGKPYQS